MSSALDDFCFLLLYRGDTVQVDTWVSASGRNGMRRDWLVYDCKTGDNLTRASRLVTSPHSDENVVSSFIMPVVNFFSQPMNYKIYQLRLNP